SRHQRNRNHPASRGFYFFAAYNLVGRPIAAFHQHVRQQRRNTRTWRWLIKNPHPIHKLQRRQNFRAFALRNNRPASAFHFSYTAIAVHANYQRIAQTPRLFQRLNMSRMQQVKAAIGKHHTPPIAFRRAKLQNRFVQTKNLCAQFHTLFIGDWLSARYSTVYHALANDPFSANIPAPTHSCAPFSPYPKQIAVHYVMPLLAFFSALLVFPCREENPMKCA